MSVWFLISNTWEAPGDTWVWGKQTEPSLFLGLAVQVRVLLRVCSVRSSWTNQGKFWSTSAAEQASLCPEESSSVSWSLSCVPKVEQTHLHETAQLKGIFWPFWSRGSNRLINILPVLHSSLSDLFEEIVPDQTDTLMASYNYHAKTTQTFKLYEQFVQNCFAQTAIGFRGAGYLQAQTAAAPELSQSILELFPREVLNISAGIPVKCDRGVCLNVKDWNNLWLFWAETHP